MKLFLAELANEGIVQAELKVFTHEQFSAVYQAYLNAGLLKDAKDNATEDSDDDFNQRSAGEEVRYTHPDSPQNEGPR